MVCRYLKPLTGLDGSVTFYLGCQTDVSSHLQPSSLSPQQPPAVALSSPSPTSIETEGVPAAPPQIADPGADGPPATHTDGQPATKRADTDPAVRAARVDVRVEARVDVPYAKERVGLFLASSFRGCFMTE